MAVLPKTLQIATGYTPSSDDACHHRWNVKADTTHADRHSEASSSQPKISHSVRVRSTKRLSGFCFVAYICFAYAALSTYTDMGYNLEPTSIHLEGLQQIEWTVLLTVNHGYLDFFLNWLSYYERIGLKNELVVVAQDEAAFQKLKKIQTLTKYPINVTRSFAKKENELTLASRQGARNYSGTQTEPPAYGFFSKGFKTMMSMRPRIILDQLQAGKNVLFTDIDMVWLGDPFSYIDKAFTDTEGSHIAMSYDYHKPNKEEGYRIKPFYGAGFVAIKATRSSLLLMERWKNRMEQKPGHNQDPLNYELMLHPDEYKLARLPFHRFPSGMAYFYLHFRRWALIAHNNCILGHRNKKLRFKWNGLWNVDPNYQIFL